MDKVMGYSLRKASEISEIPITSFGNLCRKYKVIAPDVEDKNGELTLYSDKQIERAKEYYEKNIRKRSRKSIKSEKTKGIVEVTTPVDELGTDELLPVAVESLGDSLKMENIVQANDSAAIITLKTRADKIRQLQADVQRGIIEIGRELIAAKKEIPHGQWGTWLANEFEWTDRTARNFMSIAERFGDRKTFSDLKPSILQAMLVLPEGDEEAFIEAQAEAGNPVESQSVREVQANVKAWNQRNEKPIADELTEEQVGTEDNSTADSAEDTIDDSEPDSLQVEDNAVVEEHVAVPGMSSTATVDSFAQSTENTVQAIIGDEKSPKEFLIETSKKSMAEQFKAIQQFIAETDDLQSVKALYDYYSKLVNQLQDILLNINKRIVEIERETTRVAYN